ncbi:MAG TPA: hypothetical protein VGE64_13180 [Xanthomonadaceae bacterium]
MFNSLQKRSKSATALLVALVLSLIASPAFAQASGGFDGAAIVAKIVEYGAIGVTILAAFALAKWGMRAIGLVK